MKMKVDYTDDITRLAENYGYAAYVMKNGNTIMVSNEDGSVRIFRRDLVGYSDMTTFLIESFKDNQLELPLGSK